MRYAPTPSGPITVMLTSEEITVIENQIISPTALGQTAITVNGSLSYGQEQTLIIRNVAIRSGFQAGISLYNVKNPVLDKISIHNVNENGIILGGQTLNTRIVNSFIKNALTGILVNDLCEGITIDDSVIMDVQHGIYGVSTQSYPSPWMIVNSTHIQASLRGIYLSNRSQIVLSNLLIYRDDSSPFVGIELTPTAKQVILRDVIINGLNISPSTLTAVIGNDNQFIRKDYFLIQ